MAGSELVGQLMDSANVIVFKSDNLKLFTNNFNNKNLIGFTQFGQLYRGRIQFGSAASEARDVTVKIWDEKSDGINLRNDEYLMQEIKFLMQPFVKSYQNLAKLIGYCCDKEMRAVVYDLSPMDTLQNLTIKDDLIWLQRINVISEIARLIEFLHIQNKPCLVFNLSPSHILLDSEWKPKLCEFQLISNGSVAELNKLKYTQIHAACADPYYVLRGKGQWEMSSDVFSLGVILLGLISKRVSNSQPQILEKHDLCMDNLIHVWAKKEYKPNTSLVHKSLQEDWDYTAEDGIKLTELAMQCIEFFPSNRPNMKLIVQCLEDLNLFRRVGDIRSRKRDRKLHVV